MADTSWFSLGANDRQEALLIAADALGRPAHLLEKDIWVVWALQTLFTSDLAQVLTFKGGTSLSKAFGLIHRFSEDVDLTCDIRHLVPDAVERSGVIPANRSQEKKLSGAVRDALPAWITGQVTPVLNQALQAQDAQATLRIEGDARDKLLLQYVPAARGTGYAAPHVLLEFGARATGEPHEQRAVACDIAKAPLAGLSWPTASPRVMKVERTFWEKATAAHVYCQQQRLRGERFARHWHDLDAIAQSPYLATAIGDSGVAMQVAEHKSAFFAEKDASGQPIDYWQAVQGHLQLVPGGPSMDALRQDYESMLDDGLLDVPNLDFDTLMSRCEHMQHAINQANLKHWA